MAIHNLLLYRKWTVTQSGLYAKKLDVELFRIKGKICCDILESDNF